jgi:hypothetical protein
MYVNKASVGRITSSCNVCQSILFVFPLIQSNFVILSLAFSASTTFWLFCVCCLVAYLHTHVPGTSTSTHVSAANESPFMRHETLFTADNAEYYYYPNRCVKQLIDSLLGVLFLLHHFSKNLEELSLVFLFFVFNLYVLVFKRKTQTQIVHCIAFISINHSIQIQ